MSERILKAATVFTEVYEVLPAVAEEWARNEKRPNLDEQRRITRIVSGLDSRRYDQKLWVA